MADRGSPTMARATTRASRLTVTSLPSLDPVQASQLEPFFDTLYAIARRVAAAETAVPTATAA